MSQIVEAAGFLLFSKEAPASFLLMKHPTRWDLPKGHAEAGEETLQTALRETQEETGIPAEEILVDPDFKYVIEYDVRGKKRGDYRKRVSYFLGYVRGPHEPVLTEHSGFQWFRWPAAGPIQAQTIDPLLDALTLHFARFPERLPHPS